MPLSKPRYNPNNIFPVEKLPYNKEEWSMCENALKDRFSPLCLPGHCYVVKEVGGLHAWCADKDPLAPVPSYQCVCKNDEDKNYLYYYQWDPNLKYDNTDVVISYTKQCLALINDKPEENWDYESCTCCCI